jgi:hypothetical protein
MIAYIVRSGLCLVMLYVFYRLILGKEKLFRFNRFYLIFAVAFSLTVPFISIPVHFGNPQGSSGILPVPDRFSRSAAYGSSEAVTNQAASLPSGSETLNINKPASEKPHSEGIPELVIIIYLTGLLVMAARFLRNILLVSRLYGRSEKINLDWYKIALLDNLSSPFSFLRTVFLDRNDYIGHRIPASIMKHEIEHVRQWHSHDVIFFEILNIIFWFNPIVYLLERAARINHEYLADEAVVKNVADIESYSGELIDFVRRRTLVPFACGAGSSLIKDRLLMLNTNTSHRARSIRISAAVSLSVILLIFLSLRPAPAGTIDDKGKKKSPYGKDIVIEEVFFRDHDFKPLKSVVVIDGRMLALNDTFRVDPKQVKTIGVLTGRKAVRRYGNEAKDGAVEISTYASGSRSVSDSSYFKSSWVLNTRLPRGPVAIPVSNLHSLSMWTYPVFPNQDSIRRWRTIDIMTRDYYRIKGVVVRKNGDPFPGATVSSTGNPSIAIADKDGRFLLEDISKDAVVTVAADGCEPLYFRSVFKMDLKITLDENSGPDFTLDKENQLDRDFSGRWKLNRELNPGSFGGVDIIYDISQFGSDSVLFHESRILENGRELKSEASFVFNTVKVNGIGNFENTEQTVICSVAADGRSFSITSEVKSKIGLFQDNRMKETFSLSNDGNQMIILTLYFPDTGSDEVKEIQPMVFDRVMDE